MRRIGIGISAAALAALAACAGGTVAPPPAAAPEAPPPVSTLPPAPPPPASADWRDLPLSPGDWTYEAGQGGTRSTFGGGLFALRCDPTRRQVVFSRIAAGAGAMIVTTSFGRRQLPLDEKGSAALPAADPLLDEMAFSRGRFTVETAGLDRLVIPSWPEAARVVEDCRA
jgi:hypothetical protein